MARFVSSLLVVATVGACLLALPTAQAVHLTDPFGGAGNHSLVLDNHDGGSTASTAWPFVYWNLGQTYTSGTIEFDVYMAFSDRFNPPSPTTSGAESWWTYLDFRVGETGGGLPSGSLADTMIFDSMRVEVGSGAYYFENAAAPGNGHPILPETAQHVKYTIDDTTSPFPTYTVEITPHAVGGETNVQRLAGEDNNPWRTAHILDPTKTGFDTVALGSAFGLNATPFYIDNVVITSGGNTLVDENFDDDPIGGLADTPAGHFAGATDQNGNGFVVEVVGPVPEPSTLALAMLASLCLGRRGRRQS